MLRLATALMRATEGRFNCTVGGALERLGALPAPGDLAELASGDAGDIVIVDRRTARLRRPVHVTLDGIAKGFAVDRAIRVLCARGVDSAWVNAGGDLRVTGSVPTVLGLRFGLDAVWRLSGQQRLWAAALHTAAALVLCCFAGALWSIHMRVGWRSRRHLVSGLVVVGLLSGAALSALGIFYFGGLRLRTL